MQWTESWWTSILHISEMAGSLWNFPQNVHKVGDFPFGIDLRSNDFRMHAHGDASSKGALLSMWLSYTLLLIPQILSFGSSRTNYFFNFILEYRGLQCINFRGTGA